MSNTLSNAQKKLRQGKLGDANKLLTRMLNKEPSNPHYAKAEIYYASLISRNPNAFLKARECFRGDRGL